MMDTPRGERAKAMDMGDRISNLPDELRRHVLSFLPARDAVRTSVLSPRWRHLWASARRLNVDAKGFTSQSSFINFVNALLLSRGSIPLDSFWHDADGPGIFLDNCGDTAYHWICHALRSNVEELSIRDHDRDDALEEEDGPEAFMLDRCPFTSSCLKKLHLCGVCVDKCFLQNLFSGCPALEELDMINCVILAAEFSSATLKKLSIDFEDFPEFIEYGHDIVINMPSLVSLLVGALVRAMLSLVDVQSLVTASIYLDTDNIEFADGCAILGALSNVTNLEFLIPYYQRGNHSLLSNMRLSQVAFTNLTTLSLSDWCLHDNCKVLFYVLEHSPNLEKLTLKISDCYLPENFNWLYITCAGAEFPCQEIASLNCEKLKKIEIFCPKAAGVLVTVLLTKIISPPEISIKPSLDYGC